MSLILDALRKADAERERGSVPSLHSHPVVPLAAETPPRAKARTGTWAVVGVVVALVAVAAAWFLIRREAMTPATVAAAPGGLPAAPSAVPSPTGVPPPAAPFASSPGAMAPIAATTAGAPATAVSPAAEPAPWPQAEEKKAARAETRGEAPVPVLGNVPPAEPQVYSRDQLPPDIRAQLPQFTIGGSIYSPNPAGRSLIVNGQLFREKDRLTQDLSLEEIRLKAAIFSFRGYRFEVLF